MGSTCAPEPQWALVEVSETDIARYNLVDDHDEADARTNLPSRTTARACFQTRTGCLEADQPWHVVQAKPAISGLP
jgi:hypothetical protein